MIKDKPKVSIGIPVFNGEKYISQTIESILAQTFTDYELIIADNASTDRKAEIVREYNQRDGRIRYYRQEVNLGAVKNYRKALEMARGEYFKWIAADDVITPNFLENCVNVLDKNPDIVLVYSKSAFIDDDGKLIFLFEDVMKIDHWSRDMVKRMRQHFRSVIRNGSAANVFIFGLSRTAVLKQISPLGNYFGCDFVYSADLFLQGNVYEHPELMSFYRRHQGSSSSYKGSPSAKKQQDFYDPSITNRLQVHLQLRRRYIELFRTTLTSKLNASQKIRLTVILCQQIILRAIWRLKFEYERRFAIVATEYNFTRTDLMGIHWQEIDEKMSMFETFGLAVKNTQRAK